jgi:hypothetical protein
VKRNLLTCFWLLSSDVRYIECVKSYRQDDICSNYRICVTINTTSFDVVNGDFGEAFLFVGPSSGRSSAQSYAAGQCNVIAGGLSEVSWARDLTRETAGSDANFQFFSRPGSASEPLALVTRQDDPQWSDFVHWIVTATFYAEENGITRANADRMPEVLLFGSTYAKMLPQAIEAVGSYAEIYERNIGDTFNRTQTGLNLLYNPDDNTSALLFAIQNLRELRT